MKRTFRYFLILFILFIGINGVNAKICCTPNGPKTMNERNCTNQGYKAVDSEAECAAQTYISSSCTTPLLSAECTYSWETYDPRNPSTPRVDSVTIKYDGGALITDFPGIDVENFVSLNSDEHKCLGKIYQVATGYNYAGQYTVYEYFDSYDKAHEKSATVNEIDLSDSKLTCASSNDATPISQGRTIINGYVYSCNSKKTSIYEYTDGTASVVSDISGVSFKEDYTLPSNISTLLNRHDTIYLVHKVTGYGDSWHIEENEVRGDSAHGLGVTNYKCTYSDATTEIAGENASVDPNANRHSKPRGEDIQGNSISGCKGLLGENTFKVLNLVLNFLMILGPIIALVLGTYDLITAMASGEEDAKKKGVKKMKNRLIASVLLILAPYIVKLILNIAGRSSDCF